MDGVDVDSCTRMDTEEECVDTGPNLECVDLDEDLEEEQLAPEVGMEFPTQQDAFKFYNKYAFKTGFGVRWSSFHKSKVTEKIISRKFVCNKQGQKNAKREDVEHSELARKRCTRVGCGAMMKILLTKSETWRVNKFVAEHESHELTSPTKVSKHRSHKRLHLEPRVLDVITSLNSEGIRNSQIAKVVGVIERSTDDVVTPQQIHDHLRVERRNNIGQNCAKVVKHFHNKLADDPDFFFAIEMDESLTLRSVFWADGRSRMSYQKFSDVIVFDVTYRTNIFRLPFAPFTGINHHKQSSLFGCALLADETEETFVWLFQKWLECMWGKAPGVIVTDQDAAMGNAIARVFPDTRHRYCDWHLDKNIAEHMLHFRTTHGVEFESYFNRLRDSDNTLEAETRWNELMSRYKLGERSWLPKLWDRRESWLHCYLKDIFVAGTTTSQRAESMNAFFDGFVNANTSLNDFVVQYDKAVSRRRADEETADFNTMNSIPILGTSWGGEEQAGKSYTKALFGVFSDELKEVPKYSDNKISKEGSKSTYTVGRMGTDTSTWKTVIYDISNGVAVSCECKFFETDGVLCRHALHVLLRKRVPNIPDRYILRRWTIDARHRAPVVSRKGKEHTDVNLELICDTKYQFNIAMQNAAVSETFLRNLHTCLLNANECFANENTVPNVPMASYAEPPKVISQVGSSAPHSQNLVLPPEFSVRDPKGPVTTKGRPKATTRIRSGLEESQDAVAIKQRTCSFCHVKEHNKNGCQKMKAALAEKRAQSSGIHENF